MVDYSQLWEGHRDKLSSITAKQRPQYLNAYSNIYSKYGFTDLGTYDKMMAAKAALGTERYDLYRADVKKVNEAIGRQISANKGDGGFFGSGIGRILGAVAPIAASFIPGIGPLGMALAGGAGGYLAGGDVKSAILGAALSGGGKYILGGGKIPGLGNTTVNAPISGYGPTQIAGSGLLGSLSNSGTLSALGNVGKIIGAVSSVAGAFNKPQVSQTAALKQQAISGPAEAPGFSPVRPDAMGRPASLNELAGFSQEQERSALATKGVNSGLGGEENNYYKNLLQRSLIGDGNQVKTNNPNFLLPIESNYFSGQGYNTSNVMEFLKGLQG